MFFDAVNIVSPNPIVKDWPMDVNCSVATIGGLQKLKGIDDSFKIFALWLDQKRSGKWTTLAEFNIMTGDYKYVRLCLPR